MQERLLDFDDDGFAVAARKLITARVPFRFRISGRARDLLLPYLHDGVIQDLPKLGLEPPLRRLLAVALLAEVEGQTLFIEDDKESEICVLVD